MRGGCFCYYCYTYFVVNFLANTKVRQILNWIFSFALFAKKNGTHSPPKIDPSLTLVKKMTSSSPLHHNNPQMYNEFGNVADSINDLLDLCSPLSTGWSIWIGFFIYENNKINPNPNWSLCITILIILRIWSIIHNYHPVSHYHNELVLSHTKIINHGHANKNRGSLFLCFFRQTDVLYFFSRHCSKHYWL